MEDSTADDSRNSKRARRLAPPPGDVVDRISGLDDDVLLHILSLVGDARDAVRTGALSRRWLGLWTRVPALRFASRSVSTADLERFVSFVNGVLARRSQSDCAIESLAISYAADNEHSSLGNRMPRFLCAWQRVIPPPCTIYTDSARKLMVASVDAVQGWIRYAVQHRVKSLDVDLSLPSAHRPKRWRDFVEKKPAVCLGDLPASPAGNHALGVRRRRAPALHYREIRITHGSFARKYRDTSWRCSPPGPLRVVGELPAFAEAVLEEDLP
jgi:hypothetical protein